MPLLLGTYRPPLPNGIPGIDFAVGRTSTNPLRRAVTVDDTPLAGLSTSSVTIGTGSKVFTIDLAVGADPGANVTYDANDNIKLVSAADNANFVKGTVTSLVGTTLTINVASVGGSGTKADWSLAEHLPAQQSYSTGSGIIRTGSSGADFSITDWDYRQVSGVQYGQLSKAISYSQCLFALRGISSANANQVFIGVRSGTPNISVSRCSFLGENSILGMPACVGGGVVLFEYCDISGWPSDIFNLTPVASLDTIIRYNKVQSAASADSSSGLHADCFQMTSWPTGNSLQIYGNKLEMLAPHTGGVGVTGAFNLGTQKGDWVADVQINDNWIIGGNADYPIGITENDFVSAIFPGGTFSGIVSLARNYIAGIGQNALYPSNRIPANMTIDCLRSALDGHIISFNYKNHAEVDIVGATSIP